MKKGILAVFLAAVMAFAYVPVASAATNYYPTYNIQNSQNLYELIAYLQSLVAQLQALQRQNSYGQYYYPVVHNVHQPRYRDYDVDVETLSVRNINNDEATFRGDVDLGDASYVDAWFEYGQDGRLREKTDEKRLTRDGSFSTDIDDLDEDERYYVRAVAEDPSGTRIYGNIESFTADDEDEDDDDDDRDEEPDVTTDEADDIEDDSVRLHGRVDMNDFDDGIVFFVFGQDEDEVEDAEDEDRYSDIDEHGEDLQKFRVQSGFDGRSSFWADITGLDDETDYYFRLCVEYEDEDDDSALACGDVEHFETD